MITTETIAGIINEALNANQYGESFRLFADADNYRDYTKRLLGEDSPIPGIVRSLGGDFVPIRNIDSYKDSLSVVMQVPQPRLETVRNVLADYVSSMIGTTMTIGDYDVSFNMSPPSVGNVNVNVFGGVGVEIQLYVFMQIGKGALLSNNATITINGEDALLVNASISRSVITSSNTFEGDINVKSYTQSQVLSISGVMPVQKTGITRMIKQMILDGTLADQVFTIGYNDGQDTATYSMIATGDNSLSLQSGVYAGIQLSFVEVQNG